MSSFCVIGSGISGATIANLLRKKNVVDLFDKGRGPGGRASFKRLDKVKGFDHGTQYISPKTPAFKKFILKLIKLKVLKNWDGKHLFLNQVKEEKKNHTKVIGRKGNNDISKYLLKNVNCYFQNELKKIDYKQKKWILTFADGKIKTYKKLILTCPFPQLLKLSKKFIKNPFIKKKVKMDANITVMIVIEKTNKNISSYLFNDKILGWAAKENSKKRFKCDSDLWTLQSTYKWANKKIDNNIKNKDLNSKVLIDQFFKLTGIKKKKILFSLNHGWKYSSNSNPLKIKSYWNSSLNLGVCADWFVGPRLEAGWISANDLFKKIKK
ncbi:NAD(P)-binding protein [Candidatus Pelagibacter sp.]|jgi:renalase|nr:NAD(P)-binding protein [Candidatus Pelagibacter sp.]